MEKAKLVLVSGGASCPCCGKPTISNLGDYEICSICGWEDDPVQSEDICFEGGANKYCLKEAREKYEKNDDIL